MKVENECKDIVEYWEQFYMGDDDLWKLREEYHSLISQSKRLSVKRGGIQNIITTRLKQKGINPIQAVEAKNLFLNGNCCIIDLGVSYPENKKNKC